MQVTDEENRLPRLAPSDVRAALGLLFIGLFVWNAAVPKIIDELEMADPPFIFFVIFGFLIGTVVGQVVLIAVWGALGSDPFAKRILRCMSLLIWGCLAWILSFKLMDESFPISLSTVLILAMFGGLFVTMSPLLVVRRFSSLRIYRSTSDLDAASQFAIRDIFVWTAVIAGQIAIAKFVTERGSPRHWPSYIESSQIVFTVVIVSIAVVLIGLPTTLAAFGIKTLLLMSLVALELLLLPPITFELLAIVLGGGRPPAKEYFEICLAFSFIGVGITAIIMCVLLFLRRLGFRISLPRNKGELEAG